MKPARLNPNRNAPQPAALTLVKAGLPADPFLLRHFEHFYAEIVELKAQLARPVSHGHIPTQPEAVHQKLLSLLTEQAEEVSRIGTLLGTEMYRQAQRVMACMADEIFQAVHWPAGTAWHSLEIELFEAVKMNGFSLQGPCMKKLDLLLGQDDPAYRELAAVYFYALALTKKEQQYLQPLFAMISSKPRESDVEPHWVFAQSYHHTLTENRVTLLPSAKKWWFVLAAIVLTWLAASWLLWNQVSSPLEQKLREIQQISAPQPTSTP